MRAELRDPAPVMDAAAQFLAVRPRSVAETSRRLRHLGYPADLVEEVVTRLIETGYLDDAEFARAWVESRDRSRPRGELALRRELATRGVARDVTDGVLIDRTLASGAGQPDRDAARALVARKSASLAREPDPTKRRQKAYALLARNGFDPDTCREIAGEIVSSDDSNT